MVLNLDNSEERRAVEMCYRTQRTLVNPIIDWTDDEVWEFLNDIAKVPHCCLYDEGFKRLGCIGCPMASDRARKLEFERYPKYKQAYIRAMQKMVDNHPGQIRVATGELSRGGYTVSRNGSSGVPLVAKDGVSNFELWMQVAGKT